LASKAGFPPCHLVHTEHIWVGFTSLDLVQMALQGNTMRQDVKLCVRVSGRDISLEGASHIGKAVLGLLTLINIYQSDLILEYE
jgi:hypothetical protein